MTAIPKPSTIKGAGRGLFAERAYAKGERVAYYSGTYVKDKTLEGDRVLSLNSTLNIDADGPCRCSCNRGDLVNHQPTPRCNCRYVSDTARYLRLVSVVTTRDIVPGEEFFVDYGPEFQFPQDDQKQRRS